MKTKTRIKAGTIPGIGANHNQTLVRTTKPSPQPGKTTGLKVLIADQSGGHWYVS